MGARRRGTLIRQRDQEIDGKVSAQLGGGRVFSVLDGNRFEWVVRDLNGR